MLPVINGGVEKIAHFNTCGSPTLGGSVMWAAGSDLSCQVLCKLPDGISRRGGCAPPSRGRVGSLARWIGQTLPGVGTPA